MSSFPIINTVLVTAKTKIINEMSVIVSIYSPFFIKYAPIAIKLIFPPFTSGVITATPNVILKYHIGIFLFLHKPFSLIDYITIMSPRKIINFKNIYIPKW